MGSVEARLKCLLPVRRVQMNIIYDYIMYAFIL